MITIREITSELSSTMPDYIVGRNGRKNQVDVYTSDKRMGIRTIFSRRVLGAIDKSVCPSIARIMTDTFNKAIEEGK